MADLLFMLLSVQVTQGDVSVERDTYKQSRQGLDEMYNEARRQLKEECQLRQVRLRLLLVCLRLCDIHSDPYSILMLLFLGSGE